MKRKTNCQFSRLRSPWVVAAFVLFLLVGLGVPCRAQLTTGAINGTVLDSSGAAVPDAEVKAHNIGTNLDVVAHSSSGGSYSIPNLPVGTYTVSFTKTGFETETHTQVLVTSDRTTTVDGSLKVGTVSTMVEVTATPLMNQTDATNGYVVDQVTIQDTPLGTGSFTQLAILTPGVHADFLSGGGSGSGLGNQEIYANGNRSTSNSFSLNGISTNNLFNGDSSSSVGENRFVLNTGENFGIGGSIQTSTTVYGAIGQALPTPPTDAIQEIAVNAAMFDATQGNYSGAHISVLTKSGTNQIHGSAWEEWQNSDLNAAPFFYNATPGSFAKIPFLNRNMFGATLGGPLKKDKLFYFLSYQGVRISDAEDATKGGSVPLGLTNDRSAGGLIAMESASFGTTVPAADINSAAMAMYNATLPNGQYMIPTATLNATQAAALGYDVLIQGPNATARVDQGIGDIDYQANDRDRLSVKYYYQNNPTSNPFSYDTNTLGFPQKLYAGSQVATLTNNIIMSPTVTWEQHIGFTRLRAFAATGEDFNPVNLGMSLLGSTTFPFIEIADAFSGESSALYMGASPSFANAGMNQNQVEGETSLNMVKGRHTIRIGTQWDHIQLNVINNNTQASNLYFSGSSAFTYFLEGRHIKSGAAFTGTASRYYRSNTAGMYINDSFKMRSNLTVTGGLRWDLDGPLSEKYGRLTSFDPALYSYNVAADTITGSGLEFAGNNLFSPTQGASNSLLNQNQWGIAPRLGIAWSPYSKLTLRAGYGFYYDRGELFSYFSPSAGAGFSGPFGVTVAPPFVLPISANTSSTQSTTGMGILNAPFCSSAPTPCSAPAPPAPTAANFLAYLPNFSQTASGSISKLPSGNLFGPYLYGGYNINNKLPYTQNWTLDLQYQLTNNWLFEVAYVGNHGQHEVLPVTFNEPQLATPQNPLWAANAANEQIYSYGGVSPYASGNNGGLTSENLDPAFDSYSGNAILRVPYIGYDMNSVSYNAEGVSNYNALQVQVHKRTSKGLRFTASYTYSHTLDEQSALGLFVTGNDPLNPRANYASADFDQTHVFLINYAYTIPGLAKTNHGLGYLTNGWTLGGQTAAQSGQPYSVYDYTGSVASQYFGSYDEIGNPEVPLAAGVKAKQAELQGTLGVNPATPVLNPADFSPVFLQPGQDGVPPCQPGSTTICDDWESLYGTTGRNMWRGPFQVRFDMSMAKQFPVFKDRFNLRFEADAFNIFNHPDFDTPNNDVRFFADYEGPPTIPPLGSLGQIQHTIGSPRFLQLSLHLLF